MPSPFPGMDPYLEPYWGEIGACLVVYAADQLQPHLPDRLRAPINERTFHVIDERDPRPVETQLRDEPITQTFLEIRERATGAEAITVIEFLSPSNKFPGEGQRLYLEKQQQVLAAGASLVEIDLTRSGQRVLSVPPERIRPDYRSTYQVCVRRGGKPHLAEIYRAPLQQRLPTIRIPLRPTDADVPLELQSLVDQCYRNGRYDDLDYRAEPVPPLTGDDAAWAAELLKARGLRS